MAPLPAPVPVMLTGSLPALKPPLNARVPPEATVTPEPEPRALVASATTVPELIVIPPGKVLAPVSDSTPVPFITMPSLEAPRLVSLIAPRVTLPLPLTVSVWPLRFSEPESGSTVPGGVTSRFMGWSRVTLLSCKVPELTAVLL